MITFQQVKALVKPYGNDKIINGFVTYFNKHQLTYGVNNYNRVCHFVSQCAHECDSFKTMEEYASGKAYEGRKDLGNIYKGDGVRYKGRGYIQITGRANYRFFGNIIGYDIETHPELAEDYEISVLTSLAYWQYKKLNDLADANNYKAITKRINGGYNGLDDRIRKLNIAKQVFLGITFESVNISIPIFTRDLSFGDKGSEVFEIQKKLVESGYPINIDGTFGPKTQAAVKELQNDLDLPVTGIVDRDLWEILQDGVEDSE